jgi:hypothetical protein
VGGGANSLQPGTPLNDANRDHAIDILKSAGFKSHEIEQYGDNLMITRFSGSSRYRDQAGTMFFKVPTAKEAAASNREVNAKLKQKVTDRKERVGRLDRAYGP